MKNIQFKLLAEEKEFYEFISKLDGMKLNTWIKTTMYSIACQRINEYPEVKDEYEKLREKILKIIKDDVA